MNAAAVIGRELRAESRRPANYWLRVLAAGLLFVVFASLALGADIGLSQLGPVLFNALHTSLLLVFWVLVPLMTADCVSKEKRDGTLGLLFLTPLTLADVIVGKAAIHVLRALTLFLAALPILGLPVFFGGVAWPLLTFAALTQANAVLLGIAAGIYASTKGGTMTQVMVRAELYALSLALLSLVWLGAARAFAPRTPIEFMACVGAAGTCSLLVFGILMKLSIRSLRQNWQVEDAAPERPAWVESFSSSEFWRTVFHWEKGRTLDRNPMAWLQEYSWTARLTKWGWCLAALFAGFFTLGADPRGFPSTRFLVVGGLGLGVAFSAVGSFRRENESGLLEILLVTPLRVRQLLEGRLWGMICHYLPAVAILVVFWIGDKLLNPKLYQRGFLTPTFPNPVAFCSLMIFGLYLSLSRLNFFLAWFLAWLIAFVLPMVTLVGLTRAGGHSPLIATAIPSAVQMMLAGVFWLLLYRKVNERTFLLHKTS